MKPDETSQSQHPVVGKRSRLNRLRTGQSGERLASALEVYSIKTSLLQGQLRSANLTPSQFGFDALSGLLEKSVLGLKSADLELGWGAFNAAQRIETQIYNQLLTQREFKAFAGGMFHAKAVCVYTEANKKLDGWRKDTVNSLLSQNNQLKTRIELSDLLQSEEILHEHHSNIYRRLKIVRRQFWWLAMMAIIALVGWVVFLIFQHQLWQDKIQVYDLSLTIQTVIFGVLGACISGILTLANSSTRQQIPEKLLNSWVTIARPLVGAVSALAIVVFVLIGILEFGDKSPGLYLAAAFTAGFSERLLIKTIEGVIGKDGGAGKEQK